MIDQDKDGFITELDFNSVCSVPFKLLDKDGDGKSPCDGGVPSGVVYYSPTRVLNFVCFIYSSSDLQ
jgi:hypothetical protein